MDPLTAEQLLSSLSLCIFNARIGKKSIFIREIVILKAFIVCWVFFSYRDWVLRATAAAHEFSVVSIYFSTNSNYQSCMQSKCMVFWMFDSSFCDSWLPDSFRFVSNGKPFRFEFVFFSFLNHPVWRSQVRMKPIQNVRTVYDFD